jgi:hypothetical protein
MATGTLARLVRERWRVAAWGAFASVGLSLLVRAVSRGRYYPGWDLLAATEGHFVASTQPVADALRYLFEHNRRDTLPFPLYSLPFTVVPGYLETLWPWEYWAHLVTLVTVLLTLALIVAATKLPWSRAWVVVLAWGASSTLLSFALAGFPWASAFLPHAIALWIALDRRRNRSALVTLAVCLVASETSWHVYELGKTIFVVFFAAALLLRDLRWRTRVVFLAMGVLQLWWVRTMPTSNTVEFTHLPPLTVATVLEAVRAVLDGLLVSRTFDVPILCVAGVLSLLAFRRDRVFIAVLFAIQLGLVVALALIGVGHLRPRRFLMVDFYALVAVACAAREARPRSAFSLLVLLLAAGNAWQLVDLAAFVRAPRGTYGFTLPYTQSQADYMVPFAEVDWAAEMAAQVEAGRTLIVVYGFRSYPENHTNPTAVLERLYLRLGHRRFVHSVLVFGDMPCRYCCVPVRPLSKLEKALDRIRPGGPIDPASVDLYYAQELHRAGPYLHVAAAESAEEFAAIRERFRVTQVSPSDARFVRFVLAPREPETQVCPSLDATEARYVGADWDMPFEWTGFPFERHWIGDLPADGTYVRARPWGAEPFGVELSARLYVSEPRRYEFLLGADQPATLSIDGATVVALSAADRFHLAQGGIDLPAGSHVIVVTYTAGPGPAHLLVDMLPASVAHPDAS